MVKCAMQYSSDMEPLMTRIISVLLLGMLFTFGAPVYNSCAANPKEAAKQTIEPLKHSDVCMVQNRYGMMKMIPVEVDGKMYYGCCQGCVGKLKFRPEVRFDKDPVTGKKVDKSTAFIVGNPDGTVVYFESKETAEKFFASRKSL